MKIIKTVALVLSLICAGILWATRTEWMNSLSSFALSENALYYRAMHLSIISFFILDSEKNKHSPFLAIGFAFILIFDMHHHFMLHSVFTAASLAFACFSIIYNSKGFERSIMGFLSFVAILVFCIGYFNTSFHFLLAEVIAMGCLVIGKLRETWNN